MHDPPPNPPSATPIRQLPTFGRQVHIAVIIVFQDAVGLDDAAVPQALKLSFKELKTDVQQLDHKFHTKVDLAVESAVHLKHDLVSVPILSHLFPFSAFPSFPFRPLPFLSLSFFLSLSIPHPMAPRWTRRERMLSPVCNKIADVPFHLYLALT